MNAPPILVPLLTLIAWTLVVEVWLYATRLPAMRAAHIDPTLLKRKEDLEALPTRVKQVADNFNHLHEQPIVFYALVFYAHIVGVADATAVTLAWVYVALRIAHSLVQCTFNFVPLRFTLFVLSSAVLATMTIRNMLFA